jgi:hypothetical protein
MSIFVPIQVPCPACAKPVNFGSVLSVNADRRPDLREDILAERFQREACPACGTEFRMAPEFTYVDTARGQMLVVRPRAALEVWAEHQSAADSVFDRAYGKNAAPAARAIGDKLKVRLVFGWPALLEKLQIEALGLDDVQVELLKAALLRTAGGPLLNDQRELRLMARDSQDLMFAWVDSDSGALWETLAVPESALQDLATQTAWGPLAQELAANCFVDLNRLFMPAH